MVRIGVRWHTGATEEILTSRPLQAGPARRTGPAALDLIRRLGPSTSNAQLVAELDAAGVRTAGSHPFDVDAVPWVRHVHKVPMPSAYRPGELSVAAAADRLLVTTSTVYYWISHGLLIARRCQGNRLAIAWTSEVEAACQRRVADSAHLHHATPHIPAGEAV